MVLSPHLLQDSIILFNMDDISSLKNIANTFISDLLLIKLVCFFVL
nr:MAG TPA: hypothetical protein [Caudoviricetes sp.]